MLGLKVLQYQPQLGSAGAERQEARKAPITAPAPLSDSAPSVHAFVSNCCAHQPVIQRQSKRTVHCEAVLLPCDARHRSVVAHLRSEAGAGQLCVSCYRPSTHCPQWDCSRRQQRQRQVRQQFATHNRHQVCSGSARGSSSGSTLSGGSGSSASTHIVQGGRGDVRLKQAGGVGLAVEGVAAGEADQVWVPAQ